MDEKKLKENTEKTLFSIIYDNDRELEKEEYANIEEKSRGGYFNANFLRQNVFNAKSRVTHKPFKTPKIIYETDTHSIAVTHPLSQKHADILTLIYTNNVSVSKPKSDGSYIIKIIPYQIAKKMGYRYPQKAYENVVQMIRQMRLTGVIVKNKNEKGNHLKDDVKEFTILGDSEYNLFDEYFEIKISANSAKFLSHNVAFTLDSKLNEKIISISDNKPQLKASIRYILANKATKYGFTLDFLCDKFEITKRRKKDFFKMFQLLELEENLSEEDKNIRLSEIKENLILLGEFNITFENNKLLYKTHKDTSFKMGIDAEKILQKISIQNYIGMTVYHESLSKNAIIEDISNSLKIKGRYNLKVSDGGKNIVIEGITRERLNSLVGTEIKKGF